MLALNMPSSSPRSPELEPLAYSSFTIFLTAPNKTSLLEIIPNPHSPADFSTVTTMLKYSHNYSFYSNASGTIARIHGWLLFSGIQANNLTVQFTLWEACKHESRKKTGFFIFQFSMLLNEMLASVCSETVMSGETEIL